MDAADLPPGVATIFANRERFLLSSGDTIVLSKARGPFLNVGYTANGDDLLVRVSDGSLFAGLLEEPPSESAVPIAASLDAWIARHGPIT